MARGKIPPTKTKRRRKPKRSTDDYISSAKSIAPLVPSLRKLAKRKTLTPQQKTQITTYQKKLKNIPNLYPITATQAKALGKKKQFSPNVRAIRLRGFTPDAKIRISHGDIYVVDANRQWIFYSLDRATVRSKAGMRKAGAQAFRKQLPVEQLSDLAAEAFRKFPVHQVQAWTNAGAVGDPHTTESEFVQWVNEKWNAGRYMSVRINQSTDNRYTQATEPDRWLNGLAILLENDEHRAERLRRAKIGRSVLDEMERKGRAARAAEKKRLAAKGLLDYDGTPLPTPKRKAKKRVAKATKKSPIAKRSKTKPAKRNAGNKPARVGGNKSGSKKRQKRKGHAKSRAKNRNGK